VADGGECGGAAIEVRFDVLRGGKPESIAVPIVP